MVNFNLYQLKMAVQCLIKMFLLQWSIQYHPQHIFQKREAKLKGQVSVVFKTKNSEVVIQKINQCHV